MNKKLFQLSKQGGWRHLIYVIYGGSYFFPTTATYRMIGSWNNGAVHAFKKPQIRQWARTQMKKMK